MLEALSSSFEPCLEKKIFLKPREGLQYSVRMTALCTIIAALLTGLPLVLTGNLLLGLFVGLLFALLVGVFSGLGTGGLAYIQHIALKVLLWHSRSIPWNYPQFLDYAVERILLRKVGGGYIFIHRLLLDYFASLETPTSKEASTLSMPLQKANKKE